MSQQLDAFQVNGRQEPVLDSDHCGGILAAFFCLRYNLQLNQFDRWGPTYDDILGQDLALSEFTRVEKASGSHPAHDAIHATCPYR
jgi:hypothetical protein